MLTGMGRRLAAPGTAQRAAVHLLLVAAATASLVLEPELTAHILLGLGFVGLVVAHLLQRRRIVRALLRQLPRLPVARATRIAQADLWLTIATMAMLVSGLVDWGLGHPTRIRWHAIFGVLLTITLVVHTARRRRRLHRSHVR